MVLEVAMVPGKQQPVASALLCTRAKRQEASGPLGERAPALAPGHSVQSANPAGCHFYFSFSDGISPASCLLLIPQTQLCPAAQFLDVPCHAFCTTTQIGVP